MKKVVRIEKGRKVKVMPAQVLRPVLGDGDVDSVVEVIQALIPVGLAAVEDALSAEVRRLAGERYQRRGRPVGQVRWGRQPGSISLLDQKVPVQGPARARRRRGCEIPLETSTRLQEPRQDDTGLLRRVLLGLSTQRDREGAEAVPEAFGLSPSTVSRRFIRASARKLQQFAERPLDGDDLVALFLDGKRFAEDELVLALGITLRGEKVVLGFVQTATEHEAVCTAFLQQLVARGLRWEQGLLCVIDGAKGLRAALRRVFGSVALVQRCQWHKRENVVHYLPKAQQALWRWKLQAAYEAATYAEAKAALGALQQELRRVNLSAAQSLAEGLEETPTLHHLGLFPQLGRVSRPRTASRRSWPKVPAHELQATIRGEVLVDELNPQIRFDHAVQTCYLQTHQRGLCRGSNVGVFSLKIAQEAFLFHMNRRSTSQLFSD